MVLFAPHYLMSRLGTWIICGFLGTVRGTGTRENSHIVDGQKEEKRKADIIELLNQYTTKLACGWYCYFSLAAPHPPQTPLVPTLHSFF